MELSGLGALTAAEPKPFILSLRKEAIAIMGYRDTDPPDLLELFSMRNDWVGWNNQRLRLRLREGHGQSLFRQDQLDAGYHDLNEEPLVRLEYDRFSPGLPIPFE